MLVVLVAFAWAQESSQVVLVLEFKSVKTTDYLVLVRFCKLGGCQMTLQEMVVFEEALEVLVAGIVRVWV